MVGRVTEAGLRAPGNVLGPHVGPGPYPVIIPADLEGLDYGRAPPAGNVFGVVVKPPALALPAGGGAPIPVLGVPNCHKRTQHPAHGTVTVTRSIKEPGKTKTKNTKPGTSIFATRTITQSGKTVTKHVKTTLITTQPPNTITKPGKTLTETTTSIVELPGTSIFATRTITKSAETFTKPGKILTDIITSTVELPGTTTTSIVELPGTTTTSIVELPGTTVTDIATETVRLPSPRKCLLAVDTSSPHCQGPCH